jgi:hypothetical protein
MSAVLELAERCEEADRKLRRLINNEADLSPSGQAVAVALLMSLHGTLFIECATALRATIEEAGHGK